MAFEGLSPVRFGTVSMVTLTLGANDPEVGTITQEGDETYIFVYNTGNTQITIGAGATVSAVTGYSVTVSSVTHTDVPVGVCKHATMATSTYGWLLRRGFSPYLAGPDSAVVTGNALTLGADGVWQAKGNSTAYSQVALPPVYGKATLSAASGATGWAYFNM